VRLFRSSCREDAKGLPRVYEQLGLLLAAFGKLLGLLVSCRSHVRPLSMLGFPFKAVALACSKR
jgi:hypothetical protein